MNDCNGSDSTIIAQTYCIVKVDTLRALPFYISWGSSIYAKIITTNYLGSSLESEEGNGAIIYNFPDSPINLKENTEITWGSRIGLSWEEGLSNGGTPVIDYTILTLSSDTGIY